MRTLTGAARTKSLTPKGTFPLQILEIRWAGGVRYYSDMDYTFRGQGCEVSIIKLGDVNSSGKIGASGEVSSIDFELDDTQSLLKAKINTEILEGTICVLWHHFYDLPSSDATVMHYGKMAGPIKWSEETRTFSANIESIQGKGEIGFTPSEDVNSTSYIAGLLPSAYNTPWPIIFGSPKRVPAVQIRGVEGGAYTYVLDLFGAATIERVLAKRTCIGDKNDDLYLIPATIPFSVGPESLGGHTVTTITFEHLPSSFENEKWTDEIFVDIQSSLSSNPITQIQWILDNFTDLNIDAASFATAAALMGDTPAHYALFSQQDALPLCEKIAWQARCLLFIKNGTVYVRPLFVNTVTDATITLNEAKLKSLELSFTQTEDIVTVFNAKWVQDYGGQKESSQITTTKNNLLRYGVISQDYDFFIYTTLRSVQVASSFWAYRYANSWRKASVKTFLPSLNVEAFDCIQFSHPTLSTYAIRGFAESVKHDVENNSISLEAELGSKAGDHTGGQPVEDPYYWSGAVGVRNGYTVPIAARPYRLICEYDHNANGEDEADENAGGQVIHIESGSITANNAYEVVRIEKNHQWVGVGTVDLHFVQVPSEDNIEPGKILFTKTTTAGYYGYGFPAGEKVWCYYDLNPQNHPNYFDSPITKIGDNVGIEKDKQWLTKSRSGFVVTGIEGNKVSISAGSIDPKLEKIRSSDAIGAFSAAENYGYDGERTLVRIPTADNIPPGRIIHPITDMPAGSNGKGYNAFDVSPFITGTTPSAIGAEFGTVAGSTQLVEGNTGYVSLGRKGGRNQYRPF